MPGAKLAEDERQGQLLRAAYTVALRDGLDQVTARRVATEAGTSAGLIYFHFGTMEDLVLTLLDELLAAALDAEVTPAVAALPTASARLEALLDEEIRGLPEQRGPVDLFFGFWFGSRSPRYRERINGALVAYQRVFEGVCGDVVAEWGHPPGVTATALAELVVAFVQGAAVQMLRDPAHFDVEAMRAAARALLRSRLAP
ncbi:MAG TPA: TetR family transcriptional regulator [Mycobacteriales bacterium]|jgi:AcrR family transcriptional regulator